MLLAATSVLLSAEAGSVAVREAFGHERQVTSAPHGHILTNTGVWSPDSEWIVYDIRSDPAGDIFDGRRIEMVNTRTGEVRTLYEAQDGACCGVATFHPREHKVLFILGPERPSPEWQYCAWHRRGVIVNTAEPGRAVNLDARDLVAPYTPGALRGGTHLHVWDSAGDWVCFTYEDHLLAGNANGAAGRDINQRNVGVSVPGHPVHVEHPHPRNHDGSHFTVLVTRTARAPKPGSDEIKRASEEAWVGANGYVRLDGTRQRRALAFQGRVVTKTGKTVAEVFICDLLEDMTVVGDGPLAGTENRRPAPPRGTKQRRLTHTTDRKYPGIQGPRHWLRSSPDGSRIAFLMKDDAGIAQLWTVSPNGGPPRQLTRNPWPVASAFTWSPNGRHLAFVMDNSVCVADAATGETVRLTPRSDDAAAPRPEACVFSPRGNQIAHARPVRSEKGTWNQIFVVSLGS